MTRNLRTIGKIGLSSLLLSPGLAACTVGPDYTPPKTELVPFHNTAAILPAQSHPAPPLDRWWTGFNDPMLVTVVQRALNQNLDMEKAIEHLQHEMRSIRTGRATPALVENVLVMYYDVPTPLKSIASIAVPVLRARRSSRRTSRRTCCKPMRLKSPHPSMPSSTRLSP